MGEVKLYFNLKMVWLWLRFVGATGPLKNVVYINIYRSYLGINLISNINMINVLDLFAGCGGLSSGFTKNKNYRIICGNELEPRIAETYKFNNPQTSVVVGDITQNEIKQQIINCFTSKSIECDIVMGGIPCVAFSMAGKRNTRDPRGNLFRDFVNIVENLQPKLFIIENVKGMMSMKHDKDNLTEDEKELADKYYNLEENKIQLEEKNKQFSNLKRKDKEKYNEKEHLKCKNDMKKVKADMKKMDQDLTKFRINITDKIVNIFDQLGYRVEYKLLNSADYGVPQRRERVIFFGVQKKLNVSIEFPKPTHSPSGGGGLQKWVSVKDAIDDIKDNEEDIELSHIFTKHSTEMIQKIHNTNIGSSLNRTYSESFYRCFPDIPSGTIKENHGGVFVHYQKDRVMTPRELARLQSFPDDFIFKGTKSSILKQIGNAVPCGLSIALERSVASSGLFES